MGGHVAHLRQVSWRAFVKRIHLEYLGGRWKDNIKMDLQEGWGPW